MASSVSSVNSNTTNSLYGNRNVLSGLASGMDTESMIENAVSGIRTKITNLQKKRTSTEWKQDAYRSIIDKMVNFNQKYTSYTSSTNLLSSSFFSKAVLTTTQGANASMASATGKSSSEILIDSIKQMASNARYTVGGSFLNGGQTMPTVSSKNGIDLSSQMDVSAISGMMTFNYGTKSVSINFDELELIGGDDSANALAQAIEKKLSEQKITTNSGEQKSASEMIKVEVSDDGTIQFSDKTSAGNSVYISSASANISQTLGFTTGGDNKPDSFTVTDDTALTSQKNTIDYLGGKKLSITLDGVTKSIALPTADELSNSTNPADFITALNNKLSSAFGSNRLVASNLLTDGSSLQLQFQSSQQGSTFKISGSIGKMLGIGDFATSYLDTSMTLGDMLGADGKNLMDDLTPVSEAVVDEDGNVMKEAEYAFILNGQTIGTYTKKTALDTIISDINNNTEAGVSVSLSKLTNQFVFTAKESGSSGTIDFGDGLANKMFGSTPDRKFTAGTDAVFSATVNGQTMSLTRSTNVVDFDGMSVTLKGTFSEGEAISFNTKSDADTIVSAVKSMISDYNTMISEIKKQYSTLPLQNSSGSKYEPLTDDDKSSMSESAITAYETKAKQGLLFGDQDLSALYSQMRSIFSPSGTDGTTLRAMGITTGYSSGETTIELDESKLRSMLESNPDAVKDAFTKSVESGSSKTNGVMQGIKKQLDRYASVTGATKGILVQKAGTSYSALSLLDNALQDNIDNIDDQIERWQTKLSDQVDVYTSKFTQLEQLISQMNSQSSALSGMLGS